MIHITNGVINETDYHFYCSLEFPRNTISGTNRDSSEYK
ncbi:protein of unknown function [Xenorhabdus nematophila AN6/1]|nr:protein of unknown function [Xenorhabdus nematophila AN6/1]